MISLAPFKADVPFNRDDSQRFLPKMIAMMMVLVTLLLLFSFSLGNTLKASSEAKVNRMTVHIPAGKDQQHLADRALEKIKAMAFVSRAEIVSSEELQGQMKPWLGDMQAFENLPMPKVIRVTWDVGSMPDVEDVRSTLKPLSETIEVDAPSEWARKYAYFTTVIQSALAFLAFAMLAAAALLLMFAATTSLKLHQRTVTLLHSIGAHDEYIATQFQNNAAKLAFKGSALGSCVALLLFALIGFYTRALDIALLPDLGVNIVHVIIAVIIPFVAGAVGYGAARVATLKYLKQFL